MAMMIVNLSVGDLVRVVQPMQHPTIPENRTGIIIEKIKPQVQPHRWGSTVFVVYFSQTNATMRLVPSSLEKL
tara:strand:- start:1449 stop:1667 length:219 start_codon:yes stop_codon:yes gene_type:complete